MLLSEEREISDLDTIERYFEALYHFRGEGLDKKKILDEFKNKEYNFVKAAQKFKLIEENTKTIFISKEAEAEEILRQIQLKGYTKADMRRAGQYCVQVYETEFEKMQGAGMLRPVSGDISDLFVLVSQNEYKEDIGLSLEIESGTALFIG